MPAGSCPDLRPKGFLSPCSKLTLRAGTLHHQSNNTEKSYFLCVWVSMGPCADVSIKYSWNEQSRREEGRPEGRRGFSNGYPHQAHQWGYSNYHSYLSRTTQGAVEKTGKEGLVQLGDKTVLKGTHQLPPLNSRLSNTELVINVKNECMKSTGQGSGRLSGSKDCILFW